MPTSSPVLYAGNVVSLTITANSTAYTFVAIDKFKLAHQAAVDKVGVLGTNWKLAVSRPVRMVRILHDVSKYDRCGHVGQHEWTSGNCARNARNPVGHFALNGGRRFSGWRSGRWEVASDR